MASVCLSLVCSSVASGLSSEEEEEKKTRPPSAEQPLNQNKAGAAAKSWEALLFHAYRPRASLPQHSQERGRGAMARAAGWA